MRHNRVKVSLAEFNEIIGDTEKPIYVQCGYNRFGISIISEEEDCILLVIDEDADNPM
jgi:hypothetical protein